MRKAASFFRVTFLWVLLLPLAATFLGTASNQAVLIANGDKFPVLLNDATIKKLSTTAITEDGEIVPARIGEDGVFQDGRHCVMTHRTHLNALADIIDFHVAWFSVGDELLELGEWLWTFCPFIWLALVVMKLHDAH